MTGDPDELERQLKDAKGLPASLAKVARLKELARLIEPTGRVDLRIEAHLSVSEALKESPEPGNKETDQRYIAQFAHCVALHKAHPEQFTAAQFQRLWTAFFWVSLKFLEDNPALVSAAQARAILDDMAAHCPGDKVWELHRLRMKLEMRCGDLEAAERCERRMRSAAGFDLDRRHVAVSLGIMWGFVGRHEDVLRTVGTYSRGEGIDDFSLNWADPRAAQGQLALVHLHLGQHEQARRAHLADTDREQLRSWSLAQHLEFCARTGNLDRGLELMHRHLHKLCPMYVGVVNSHLHAAVAALLRRVIEAGRGHESFHLPKDDGAHGPLETCGGGRDWTYEQYFHSNLAHAMHYAFRVDNVYATTVHSRSVHRIAHAEPVARVEMPEDRWHRPAPPVAPVEGDYEAGLMAIARAGARPAAERLSALWELHRAAEADDRAGIGLDVQFRLITELVKESESASVAAQLVSVAERVARAGLTTEPERARGCLMQARRAAQELIDRMTAYVPLRRLRALLEAADRLPEGGGFSGFALRIRLESYANRAERVAELWERASRSAPSNERAAVAAGRAFAEVGRDEEAIALLEPRIGAGGVRADDLLLPYLRTGRAEQAERAHAATADKPTMDDVRLAAHLLYCLETSRLVRGRELLHRHLKLYAKFPGNPTALRGQAASVRLASLFIRAGEGDDRWAWGTDQEWTYRRYVKTVGADAWRRARRMELCYGTDHLSPMMRELAGPHPQDLPETDPAAPR